tara:strand:- start:39 stop:152 length:114 start_codon:yes stop_codon:yes gene_type:complete
MDFKNGMFIEFVFDIMTSAKPKPRTWAVSSAGRAPGF